jgi:MOSC domain-containing protein YiiM
MTRDSAALVLAASQAGTPGWVTPVIAGAAGINSRSAGVRAALRRALVRSAGVAGDQRGNYVRHGGKGRSQQP